MIVLIVLGSLLALLLFLLNMPVSARVAYRQEKLTATVHYLFLKFDFSPEALAKRAERDAEKALKKEDRKKVRRAKKKTRLDKTEGAAETVEAVWGLVRASGKALNKIRRGLTFYKVELYISVGGPDAHQAAVRYGYWSAFVYTLLGIWGQIFTLKKPEVHIAPDFLVQDNRYDLSFRVRIRPATVLLAGISLFRKFLQLQTQSKTKRRKNKGGIQHEPTPSHQ